MWYVKTAELYTSPVVRGGLVTAGTVEAESTQKKGYKLPRAPMTNSDLTRLINSDEVQSVVRPKKTVRYLLVKLYALTWNTYSVDCHQSVAGILAIGVHTTLDQQAGPYGLRFISTSVRLAWQYWLHLQSS